MEAHCFMYSNTRRKAPLQRSLACMIILLGSVGLSGCLATTGNIKTYSACGMRDYCPERDGPRQYIRAPDGWGGKYCLNNPMEC